MHIMTWKADDTAPKTGPVTVVERFSKGENREQASADRACSKSAKREGFLQNPRREAGDGRNRAMRRRNSGKS